MHGPSASIQDSRGATRSRGIYSVIATGNLPRSTIYNNINLNMAGRHHKKYLAHNSVYFIQGRGGEGQSLAPKLNYKGRQVTLVLATSGWTGGTREEACLFEITYSWLVPRGNMGGH